MRTSFIALMLGIAAAVGLLGCTNPYTQFYRGQQDARTLPNYQLVQGPPQIFATNNFPRDIAALERRGYAPIGESSFNAAANRVSERQLRAQAAKVGAAVVLVASRYTGTLTGAMPLVIPNTTTSYTTGNATVTGMGGMATVNGSATTTTYGTRTLMMPYSIQREDFDAVYFVKIREHLGVFYGAIDDATRERLQTNAGALIRVVVEGSAADRADILPGDIILTIDGERVDGPEDLNKQINAHLGTTVTLGIDRQGKRIKKRVAIPTVAQ